MDPNKLPPAFCVLPWMHTAINPNGDVSPCCMSEFGFSYGNLNKTPQLKDIFNSDTAKSVRKEMLESDRLPEVCNRCSFVETVREGHNSDRKVMSYRQRMNERYGDFIETLEPSPDGSAEFRQLYIDYRFSNKCNFKCITCGPQLSSSHAVEFKKMKDLHPEAGYSEVIKPLIEVDHASMFEQFKQFGHEVREIYFAGGEPLINDHHYEILQYFIDSQQPIYIYYNTNFSELRYRNHNLLDMWRRINGKIDIFASIDGYGPEGEAIRFGLDTKEFENNVNTLVAAKIPNVNLHFSITFGIANYHSVVDTAVWLANLLPDWYLKERNLNAASIGFNPITFSKEFSTLFMNQQQRQQAIRLITQQIEDLENQKDNSAFIAHNLREHYLSWISNIHRAAYDNTGKRNMILTRWGYMNRTNPIRDMDWKQRLPNLARLWAEIWHELDQLDIDMPLRNRNHDEIVDIDAYIAKHKIGQL